MAAEPMLPDGWKLDTLSEVLESHRGGVWGPEAGEGAGYPVLRSTNMRGGRLDFNNVARCRISDSVAQECALIPGDILVSKSSGSPHLVGLSALYQGAPDNGTYVFSNFTMRLRPDRSRIRPEYLALFLASSKAEADRRRMAQDTTGLRNLRTREYMAQVLPLPPLPEQQRLVEKLERLLVQSRTAREALDRIPPLLKRFRQAVLAKAFRGELTERDPSDEPAELLLSAPAGKQSPKKRAGRLWGSGVVPGLTNKERRSLPETWAWAKVGDLGERREETVQVGPMSMRSKDLGVSGVPVLNVGCIRWGYIDERKLDFMPDSLAGAFERYRVKTGDVMFTRSGTVGRSAVVQPTQEGWLMTFHLLRVRVSPAKCLPEYLQLVFQGARHVGRQTSDASIGTTRAGFNTNLLAMLDVPLAPLGEQRRIVDEVKALFAQADAIEQAAVKARQRSEQVDQAVLARAFRGGL